MVKLQPKIKEYRERKGIKQKWLAEQIGVSNTQLRRWETGENMPAINHVWHMMKVLECGVEELYEEVRK